MKKAAVLECGIQELGFSKTFCKSCEILGVHTIAEILAQERSALIRQPAFSFHWLAELVSFLEKEDLGYLLHHLPTERISG